MGGSPELSEFEQVLKKMNKAGSFTASILASQDGLPVAAAPHPSPYDADTVAAMVTLVKDFVQQTQVKLALPEVDEVSIRVGDRSRLVCRYFGAAGQFFVLAVLAPPDLSYRRLTTQAIQELRAAWAP